VIAAGAGAEWLVEARGCDPAALRDLLGLKALCERILAELELRVLGEARWHQFGGPAGITGLYLLAESHLALHTFPEHGLATFNLYCCRPRAAWPWEVRLAEALAARDVLVRVLERG
jgi:S-adenosylmethionine decarboxylase